MNSEEKNEATLFEKIANPSEFFDFFHDWWMPLREEDSNPATEALKKINHERGIDVIAVFDDAIEMGSNVFEVGHVIEKILFELELQTKSLLELFEKLHEGMNKDLSYGVHFNFVRNLVVNQREFSTELLETLILLEKPFVVNYVSHFLIQLSKDSFVEIHEKIVNRIDEVHFHARLGMVLALGGLDYGARGRGTHLKKTLAVLKELELDTNGELLGCLTQTYGNLLKHSSKVKSRLKVLIEKDDPEVNYAIANILENICETMHKEKWFTSLLLRLRTTRCALKGTLRKIDFMLRTLSSKDLDSEIAEEFILEWLKNSDYRASKDKIYEIFPMTIAEFHRVRPRAHALITYFFNDEERTVHAAAMEIVAYNWTHELPPLIFDKTELKKLEFKDHQFIARKVLGYVSDPANLCSLCFSFLDSSPNSRNSQELVLDLFINVINEDYPSATESFMKKINIKEHGIIRHRVAEKILNALHKYQHARAQLPQLKELMPSNQQTYIVDLESHKVLSKEMERTRKSSVFVSATTNISLKYACGWFHFVNGEYTSPTPLSSISSGIEIPSSSVTNPVESAMREFSYRIAER
jgi:hypothetical protein